MNIILHHTLNTLYLFSSIKIDFYYSYSRYFYLNKLKYRLVFFKKSLFHIFLYFLLYILNYL